MGNMGALDRSSYLYCYPGRRLQSTTASLSNGEWYFCLRSIKLHHVLSRIVSICFAGLCCGRRAFCHTTCWIAPFMILGRKLRNALRWPSLKLNAVKENCIGYKKCTKSCPMSLDVNGMVQKEVMENIECILCGTCVDLYPEDVITYSFSTGK